MADVFERLLGPRPSPTLDIEQCFVTANWVPRRRPDLVVRDFDLGSTTLDAARDAFDAPFVLVRWDLPPRQFGLALAPATLAPF